METVPCPHCQAPIRPTATFCLACDTPLTDTSRGLSVAESVPVQPRLPIVGVAVTLGVLLAVGGAAYWMFSLYRHGQSAASTQASSDVSRAVRILVSAESGHGGACRELGQVSDLAGSTSGASSTLAGDCLALVGHDHAVHLDTVSVDRTHLSTGTETGTARVRATVTDGAGRHDLDRTVDLVRRNKVWVLSWDGRPLV